VKSIAPNKPTLYVTIPNDNGVLTSQLEPFEQTADYVGADYYPVGKGNNMDALSGYAQDTRRLAGQYGRQSMFVLQAFSWSEYEPAPDRFPTRGEMQSMRDTAISDGDPQMMLWYAFNDVMDSSDPSGNWENVKAAAFAPYVQVTGVSGKRCVRKLKAKVSVRTNSAIRKVRAKLDGRRVLKTRRERAKLPRLRLKNGKHVLRVTATDRQGKKAKQVVKFRSCLGFRSS
jgi:hypothetical protein